MSLTSCRKSLLCVTLCSCSISITDDYRGVTATHGKSRYCTETQVSNRRYDISSVYMCVCVCVCAWLSMLVMLCFYLTNLKESDYKAKEMLSSRERERERVGERERRVGVCVCVCVCVGGGVLGDQMSSPGISTLL